MEQNLLEQVAQGNQPRPQPKATGKKTVLLGLAALAAVGIPLLFARKEKEEKRDNAPIPEPVISPVDISSGRENNAPSRPRVGERWRDESLDEEVHVVRVGGRKIGKKKAQAKPEPETPSTSPTASS